MNYCARNAAFFALGLCIAATGSLAQDTAMPERVFTSVEVVGNDRFRDEDVRATSGLRPGEAYTEDDIVAGVEALEFTGEFESVRIFSRGDTLTIRVKEEPEFTGSLAFGLGYDSDIGAFGNIGLRLDDVLDGRRFDAELTFSQEVLIASTELSGDAFWPGERRGGVRANFSQFDYDDTLFDFETATLSPYIGFGDSAAGFSGEFRLTGLWTDISSVDPLASNILQAEAGDRFVAGPGVSLVWNDPAQGRWSAGVELDSYGGDASFSDARIALAFETPFIGPTSLKTRARYGAVSGDTTVADRRTLGGSSMRGFARGGITPVDFCAGCGAGGADVTTDLGGERYAVVQVDLMLPIMQDRLPFTPSIYFDAGSVWDVGSTTAPSGVLFDDRTWRTSYGLAVTAETPYGDLSASYAIDSDSESFDDTATFGLAFTSRF